MSDEVPFFLLFFVTTAYVTLFASATPASAETKKSAALKNKKATFAYSFSCRHFISGYLIDISVSILKSLLLSSHLLTKPRFTITKGCHHLCWDAFVFWEMTVPCQQMYIPMYSKWLNSYQEVLHQTGRFLFKISKLKLKFKRSLLCRIPIIYQYTDTWFVFSPVCASAEPDPGVSVDR